MTISALIEHHIDSTDPNDIYGKLFDKVCCECIAWWEIKLLEWDNGDRNSLIKSIKNGSTKVRL